MADGLNFSLIGVDEVLATLRKLPVEYEKRGFRFAARKGANIVRKAAVRNAQKFDDPETPASIAKNIVVSGAGRRRVRKGEIKFRVGVLGGARNPRLGKKSRKGSKKNEKSKKGYPGGETYYWRHKEFGTKYVSAEPFMLPALTENINAVLDEFVTQLDKWTSKNLEKIKRQK